MPNTVCWHCEALTQHEAVSTPSVSALTPNAPRRPGEIQMVHGAFRCVSCNALAVAIAYAEPHELTPYNLVDYLEGGETVWLPGANITKSYDDVPGHIASAATEAFECHSRRHYRASILLCRSVIEATAKEKGITSGVLRSKIAALYDQGFIRKHIKLGADSVRHFGNEMAHGDFVTPVAAEDSKLVIALMEEILAEVFQSPEKVNRAEAAVAERKSQDAVASQQGQGQKAQ